MLESSLNWVTEAVSSYWSGNTTLPINTNTNSSSTSEQKSSSTESKNSPVTETITGLENLGNTCFFNSSVQALLSCPKFVDYIMKLSHQCKQQSQLKNKSCSELLLDCYRGDIKTPTKLFEMLCSFHPSEFSALTQSDAHESFNKIMEIVELEQNFLQNQTESSSIIQNMFEFIENENENQNENKNSKIIEIKNPFHGLLQNSVHCCKCRFQNELRQTTFSCLSIPLNDGIQRTAFHSDTLQLQKLIDQFQIKEKIQNYRCIKCECQGLVQYIRNMLTTPSIAAQLSTTHVAVLQEQQYELEQELQQLSSSKTSKRVDKKDVDLNDYQRKKYRLNPISIHAYRTNAIKQQNITRFPSVLCIHINRLNALGNKDSTFVSFPLVLNLNHVDTDFILNHKISFKHRVRAMFGSQYLLMAVIVHHGRSDSAGHYTIYRRKLPTFQTQNQSKNKNNSQVTATHANIQWQSGQQLDIIDLNSKWFHISDDYVQPVNVKQVLLSQSYMLFYQKNSLVL